MNTEKQSLERQSGTIGQLFRRTVLWCGFFADMLTLDKKENYGNQTDCYRYGWYIS